MLTKGAFGNPIDDQRRIRNPINDQRRIRNPIDDGGVPLARVSPLGVPLAEEYLWLGFHPWGVPLARVSPLAPKDLFFTRRINEVPLVIYPNNGLQRNLSGSKGKEESIGSDL